MAKRRKSDKRIIFDRRLKELKLMLKPYRNKYTVNLLRVITGSSGHNLNDHWESLECVLTGEYSRQEVMERIQSVVNKILENGEYSKSTAQPNLIAQVIENRFTKLHIDSKAKVLDKVKPGNIESVATVIDRISHCHIEN